MTTEDYFIAWGAYYVGVLILMWGWWQITKWLPWRIFRTFLRAMAAAILIFPYTVGEDYSEMAPGFLVWLLALLFEENDSAIRSGMPLLVITLGTCLVACVADLLWQRRQQARLADADNKQKFDELVQISRDAAMLSADKNKPTSA